MAAGQGSYDEELKAFAKTAKRSRPCGGAVEALGQAAIRDVGLAELSTEEGGNSEDDFRRERWWLWDHRVRRILQDPES